MSLSPTCMLPLLLLIAAGDISLKDAAAHLLWLMLKVRAAGGSLGGMGDGKRVWALGWRCMRVELQG